VGSVALDASVVIGLLDAGDANHDDAVAAMERTTADVLLMSAVTVAEVLVAPARAGRADEVEAHLRRLDVRVVDVDAGIARSAAALRAAHVGLALPDALVLATALAREADVMTLDKGLARAWERVR
jgi:predicted nucleic acid-binding protein